MSDDLKFESDDSGQVKISGPLDIQNIDKAKQGFRQAAKHGAAIDVSGITRLDTAGALLLKDAVDVHKNLKVDFSKLREDHKSIMKMVEGVQLEIPPHTPRKAHFVLLMEHIGKGVFIIGANVVELLTFFGRSCVELVKALARPRHLRINSISHHIEHIGINAVPIVSLIAFLISIVLAYQGVAQLRPLGAEQFTVNLVAISVLREMGVLLTAIMVAGRSGSAFTAEIGVMKVREEIDALRTIGMDPYQVLVVPRIIALIITLPLLTFIANIAGLVGGAILSNALIDTSFYEYMERVQHVVTWKTFFVGMIKSPVFAIAIGVVGCMHGMKVSGSAESVGKETTSSVVKSIFLVLMLDALFSIFFEQVGL